MNRIAVLTEQEARGIHIEEQISRFCKGKGLFPRIEPYQDQEDFFKAVPRAAFGYAVIALPGVAGAERGGASALTLPRVQNHLVQRLGFFAPRFPTARRLLSAGAGNRRVLPTGTLCLAGI